MYSLVQYRLAVYIVPFTQSIHMLYYIYTDHKIGKATGNMIEGYRLQPFSEPQQSIPD